MFVNKLTRINANEDNVTKHGPNFEFSFSGVYIKPSYRLLMIVLTDSDHNYTLSTLIRAIKICHFLLLYFSLFVKIKFRHEKKINVSSKATLSINNYEDL